MAQRGLTWQPAPAAPPGAAGRARERVRAAVEEVGRLDAEVEALSARLEAFTRAWERGAGLALAELAEAERLVRRLQRAEDELHRLVAALTAGPKAERRARRAAAPRRPPPGAADEEGDEAAEAAGGPAPGPAPEEPPQVEAEARALKRLWRGLARILHPDLASDDAERARLSTLMARANAAYERGDLTELEIMAARVSAGAGDEPRELSEAERLDHLERRAAALAAVRESLRRERARLEATDTARLLAEAERRRAAGGDLVAEAAGEARAEAAAARGDALARLERLQASARDLARLRRTAMDRLTRRGPTGALRPFDPVAESPLVRRGAALLSARRATPAARELARRLEEEAAGPAAWSAVLTLLAFLGEAGGTPPESLCGATGTEAAWAEATRGLDAPDLARVLARLPRHLTLGLRRAGKELPFGVHLAEPELAAGVRLALGREPVRRLAARVLAALGPRLRCRACRAERPALHLLRVRGLDEVHGLVCPSCGAVLRSYWQYGEPGGLEALAPLSLELGLTAEVGLTLCGAPLALQLLPAERERLTAGGLRERLRQLLFVPYRVEVPARALRIRAGGKELAPRQRVPAGRLGCAVEGGPLDGAAALELLRARVERRFRE